MSTAVSGIQVVTRTHSVEVKMPYNPKLLYLFKEAIPQDARRWSQGNKLWIVTKQYEVAVHTFIKKHGNTTVSTAPERIGAIPPMPELTIDIPLKRTMFPFQRTGVAYSLEKKRLIVGDQPGLGKTTQAIATMVAATTADSDMPILVVCPSSLKLNWQQEVHMISDLRAILLTDANMRTFKSFWNSRDELGNRLASVFIINYESLKKFFVHSIDKPADGGRVTIRNYKFNIDNIAFFKFICFDESHRLKDFSTQQSKIARGIAQGKQWVLMLTGTPVVNRPKDLCCQLAVMDQLAHFGGYKGFINRYCGNDGKGFTNLKELNYRLSVNCFYQRQKHEVLKDLPAKMRQVQLCELSNRAEYGHAMLNFQSWLNAQDISDEKKLASLRAEALVQMGVIKRLSAMGKLKSIYEFIDDVLASGEKLIVFVDTIKVGQEIKNKYHALSIVGDDSIEARNEAVQLFQNKASGRNLIVCSIKAAGVGLTLTASSKVAFVELPWTAAACEQCEDRAHRIGQIDSVNCYYFLGKGTIDEDIYEIINEKRKIANAVTGAIDNVEVSTSNEINELLLKMRK
jgi:SWI/SNF-related matrix-associated actin-dependent regulator 1 of chromatin subfamily A